ncbi:hypothetical protein D9758_009411 [Tetrapyrgos nigripes]|uniref:EGF-like domain-containing protein n=1 Tax=Tetrapyrgos nigripes TaxID=182062 RepID=A0A8H5D1M4_9AGAR|nr:hypothetical protein D9758_009411 [Tetrapyrgos nigripes]
MINLFFGASMHCLTTLFMFAATVVAQSSSPSVVCVAGQCLQGFSNITIGTTISASGAQTSALLLPGQYTSSTNPQLLHDLLTSSSPSLSPSSGFENSSQSTTLPLDIALEAGLAIYSQSLYGGSAGFSSLPSSPLNPNSSTPITAESFALSSNVWVALSMGSNDRVVFWDSVPDVSQLGISGSISLLDIQSSACSPPCSGSGVCSASSTCTCPSGFTGTSCESCAPGHFGPSCQPCPEGCDKCDEGIGGSGQCLSTKVTNAPSSCNCLNGQCGSNGQCTCNSGWTTADNGTACAKCASGFFLTSTGDCSVCQLGCTSCADGTGQCLTCSSGFTQDANDKTKCNPTKSTTSDGTVCPDGSFASGTTCQQCSPSCQTCKGPTSNDCIICATGSYKSNGSCVTADGNGVCAGSNLIADNNKHECDTCGAKCTSCKIPNFSAASTVNQAECTGCLPGSFLSNGKCVDACPSGTFVSPTDNVTCTACDSSCGSCVGSAKFCLTCSNNQLAFEGSCVASCPSNSIASNTSKICQTCHPDCASCSGTAFNQCSSCPPERPVLSNGRCLPTCSKSQYFDKTSNSCQACDSSCSSCSGSGSGKCLACSSSTQVLRGGSCVSANCNGTSSVIPGLGVCLSELVEVPQASGTSAGPTLPTITGLTEPTQQEAGGRRLEWWEILLMALGCAFIFLVFILCWRRRARRRRLEQTKRFAEAKNLDKPSGWKYRLVRFGEKLFGHRRSHRVQPLPPYPPYSDAEPGKDTEELELLKLRNAEEARHNREMEKLMLYGDYQYDRDSVRSKRTSTTPSTLPSLSGIDRAERRREDAQRRARDLFPNSNSSPNRLSGPSLYSQMTGIPRNGPEAKQPVKTGILPHSTSRFSSSSLGTSNHSGHSDKSRELLQPNATGRSSPMTVAEEYARSIKPKLIDVDSPSTSRAPSPVPPPAPAPAPLPIPTFASSSTGLGLGTGGQYWITPNNTGATAISSKNPFRI